MDVSMLWSHYEEIRELTGERDNARNNVRCTQARKTTHGLDGQHQTWTGLPVEESVKMTENRDKWRKYTSMVWRTLGSMTAKEQNTTDRLIFTELSVNIERLVGFITLYSNCDGSLKGRCYGNRFVAHVGEN